jgi:deoxyadenosine/deoxycytidine kinase
MKPRYIAIEGPIGVGKTSLARMLAEEIDARLVTEDVEENPFLRKFYESRSDHAFQTQIFFLLQRYRQQMQMAQPDLFQQTSISDYLFDKDRIFAKINLDDNELALYEQIYSMLDRQLARPDLVVILQASPRVLLDRIRRRGRDYERSIDIHYLEKLSEAYNDYFFYFNDTSLLVVNTDGIDFVKSRGDFEELLKKILSFTRGIQFFVPLGSR